MESITEIFRIGYGPSSSHTMAPRRAAEQFKTQHPDAARFKVTLYGSLAATGRGHLTDRALIAAFNPLPVEIEWKPDVVLPFHPNGMDFFALDPAGNVTATWRVYSTGGGALVEEGKTAEKSCSYPVGNMDGILRYCTQNGKTFWEYVEECEGKQIWDVPVRGQPGDARLYRAWIDCRRGSPRWSGPGTPGLDLPTQDSAQRRRSGQRRLSARVCPGRRRRERLGRQSGHCPHLRISRSAARCVAAYPGYRLQPRKRVFCARWLLPG